MVMAPIQVRPSSCTIQQWHAALLPSPDTPIIAPIFELLPLEGKGIGDEDDDDSNDGDVINGDKGGPG
jgi:hypothetical protein